jgi:non-heme Fe2+,alpha-ketoglutarate-dependent halogenase
MNYRLNEEQKKAYKEKGYLIGLPPVFEANEVQELQHGFQELCNLLEPHETPYDMIRWHMSSRWLYDVCTKPQILDYVEDLLGPDFYLWGTGFFAKAPRSEDTVPWHQDSYYWPLEPHRSVSIWLAFEDVDEENGAMKVIPGTHHAGLLKHLKSESAENKLKLELDKGSFHANDAVSLILKAGQVSIHDDAMVHGSPANRSDRWRIGLAIRYSSTEVKCDITKWPQFQAYPVRGVDRYNHNPKGVIPTLQFARPKEKIVIEGVNTPR